MRLSLRSFMMPAVLVTATGALVVGGVAAPASAHDVLLDSSPQDGETVDRSVEAITLTFNNEIQDLGSQLVLTDGEGTVVAEEEGTAQGTLVAFEFDEPLANGDYTAAWRVVSSDSHPIEGDLAFTVDDPSAVVEPAEQDTPEPTQAPATDTETPNAPAATSDTAAAESEESEGQWPVSGIIIGAALGALVGTFVVVAQRRRHRK